MATAGKMMTRHVQLLAALLATEMVRPLMAKVDAAARIFSAVFFVLVLMAVFRAVFDTRQRRLVGWILGGITLALNLADTLVPAAWQPAMEIIISLSAAAFFAFVLFVILDHVFGARTLRMDDIVGAFSGYIIIGVIWGRLYVAAWLLAPDYFSISPEIKWQLGNWNMLHALFDYYSFTTISTIGYGDITTTGPATNTLVWLEVMCGQFYLAVVVATIVGIKMSQALAAPRDGG
jgi:voltage-gated potassium channel